MALATAVTVECGVKMGKNKTNPPWVPSCGEQSLFNFRGLGLLNVCRVSGIPHLELPRSKQREANGNSLTRPCAELFV